MLCVLMFSQLVVPLRGARFHAERVEVKCALYYAANARVSFQNRRARFEGSSVSNSLNT